MKATRKLIVLCLVFMLSSCAATLRNFTPEQKLEFEQFVQSCDTPEKLQNWMIENFEYGYEKRHKMRQAGKVPHARSRRQFHYNWTDYPIDVYHRKTGVCQDSSNFCVFILRQHGYKAKMTYTFNPGYGSGHYVAEFERDSKWWKIGDTNSHYIEGPYDSVKEIALSIIPGAKDWFVGRHKF